VSALLRTALKKIEGWLFKENVIVTSQPVRSQDKWQILQGDLAGFRFEEFPSRDEAEHAARLIVNAASMGPGLMNVKVIILTSAQLSLVHDAENCRVIVRREDDRILVDTAPPVPHG
jgi:hypothetical protein